MKIRTAIKAGQCIGTYPTDITANMIRRIKF